jgi:Zn-dependent protease/predicted transcriptional regulator
MEPTVRVGKIFGIELNLGYSWFLIFVFATIVMAMQFDSNFPEWSPVIQFGWGLAMSVLFFLSILGHELAHSIVAMHYKIRVHSIKLHVFGGWARLGRPPRTPAEEFAIAIAGPLSSLFFASCFGIIWVLSETSNPALSLLTGQLAWINLVLALFNSLPGFPLDGGLVLRAIVWSFQGKYTVATRIAAYSGQVLAMTFMITGIFLFLKIGLSGFWFLIIGYNLYSSSRMQMKDAQLRDNFKSFKVSDISLQQLPQVGAGTSVSDFLDSYVFGGKNACYLVVDENVLQGMITPAQAEAMGTDINDLTTVNQIMTPLNNVEILEPDTEIMQALELMDCTEIAQLPVVRNQQLQGFVSRDLLIDFIRARFEYGSLASR